MSIAEVTVGLGLLSVAILGGLNLFDAQQKQIKNSRIAMSRDAIKVTIEGYLRDKTNLDRSVNLSGNENFKSCLQGGAEGVCATNCCNAVSAPGSPFSLLDPSDSTDTRVLTTANESDPQRFNSNGQLCPANTPLSDTCPIELITKYTASCALAADPCDRARRIAVYYEIRKGATGIAARGIASGIIVPSQVSGSPLASTPKIWRKAEFSANGSFVVPAEITRIRVELWGGGRREELLLMVGAPLLLGEAIVVEVGEYQPLEVGLQQSV